MPDGDAPDQFYCPSCRAQKHLPRFVDEFVALPDQGVQQKEITLNLSFSQVLRELLP